MKTCSKRKIEDPVNFSGKVLRELAEDPNFTLKDFKARYNFKRHKRK
jgi:hypothetical protein